MLYQKRYGLMKEKEKYRGNSPFIYVKKKKLAKELEGLAYLNLGSDATRNASHDSKSSTIQSHNQSTTKEVQTEPLEKPKK